MAWLLKLIYLTFYTPTYSTFYMFTSTNSYFVDLIGPDLGLELFSQTNLYTTSPFDISQQGTDWSLIQSSMGGCWNQFSTPLRCLWCRFSLTIPIFTQVTLRTIITLNALAICYNQLSCNTNQGLRCFCTAMVENCTISPIYTANITLLTNLS